MHFIAKSPSGKTISFDEFFFSKPGIKGDSGLCESITRTLKTILRNPNDVDVLAKKLERNMYYLEFRGKNGKYKLTFELGDDMVLLSLI